MLAGTRRVVDNGDMAIKVAAFDVYGTLACWPDDRVQPIEVQQLLGRYGIEISYQAFEAARQGVLFFDAVRRPIEGWMDFLALAFARMEARIPVDLIAELAHLHESRNRMELLPEAEGTVDAAKQAGLVTCAFTTLPKFMLADGGQAILRNLDHYFDAAATGFAKGHPAFYRRVTELLGVRPDEILCVGDDPICDVLLPQASGWQAVWLRRPGVQVSPGVDHAHITHNLSELSQLFIRT